ncbi:MAG: hypothetical protein IT184_12565 [Acidobacteria bacterium]|nr:hypothetical protein [Acidobacteriota bacterium]
MSSRLTRSLWIGVGVLAAAVVAAAQGRGGNEAAGVERVVVAFNRAISERRIDDAAKLVADDAVQFAIRPAHAFTGPSNGAAPALTSDLEATWRTVVGVLSSAVRRYDRTVLRMDTRVDDRLAMVWATIRTETEPRDGAAPSITEFAEVYLLRGTEDGWQIVGTANSRPTR